MNKKIAIIANGSLRNPDFNKNLLEGTDLIICADGGANFAYKINVFPDYIIGDLDSISYEALSFFEKNEKTKIIKDTNKDKTDLELALDKAKSLKPEEIIIIGAIGSRIDHTLANIFSLMQIPSEIKAKIVDEKNTLELINSSKEITDFESEIVSIIPLTDVYDLNYKGMKWNVKNKNTSLGWFGISNKIVENNAKIEFKKGKLLVIRTRE